MSKPCTSVPCAGFNSPTDENDIPSGSRINRTGALDRPM
ncbi:hypothetical protein SLNWT_4341 [Streptomyces albus]|uniref:Uncharacterized protein n=1 Tax=Streptomyces albus (strain ATCC 21838 / DSM 41398 / FERM P-419 / JCM 4703 / NBRC 107858) TaxID=1081613 RepID=A0A0B5F308_STRA4|nr:hypothetical protein SLNWT_4341 [Streptomyces albus]AOU79023.1 hypothetical protein SLNHY_4332 [Streptomyces albus]AYN34759.1 hypothetical protein DUI70_4261 [Streptomyces albus]